MTDVSKMVSKVVKFSPSLSDFYDAADRALNNKRSGSTIKLGGKTGVKYVGWHTWKSTNVTTMRSFVNAIDSQYGAYARTQIRSWGEGRPTTPLSARKIKNIQHELTNIGKKITEMKNTVLGELKAFKVDTSKQEIADAVENILKNDVELMTALSACKGKGEMRSLMPRVQEKLLEMPGIEHDWVCPTIGLSVRNVDETAAERNLVRIPTFGDGNCFFYSILLSLSSNNTGSIDLGDMGGELAVPATDNLKQILSKIQETKKTEDSVLPMLMQFHKRASEQKDVLESTLNANVQGNEGVKNFIQTLRNAISRKMQNFLNKDDNPEEIKLSSDGKRNVDANILSLQLEEFIQQTERMNSDLDLNAVPFAVSVIKRPIVIIPSGSEAEKTPIVFDMDIETGKKLEGEPIYMHFGCAGQCGYGDKLPLPKPRDTPNHFEACISAWK